MTQISVTPTQILAGVAVLLIVGWVWRAGARRAKAAAEAARSGAQLLSLAGRVLFTAGLIVGVQWLVITHPGNPWLLLAALGLPALFSSYTLTRALTVTVVDSPRRRGRR
jgi:ABC-type xylose transport system permease subunit